MTEPKEVEAELMEAIEGLKGVSAEEQEIAYIAFGEKYGPEAAAKARELLAAAVLERAARITAELEAAAKAEASPNPAEEARPLIKEKPSTGRNLGAAPTPKPAPIPKPKPAPRPEEEPKKAAVRRRGVLDKEPITEWPSEWPEPPTPPPGAQGFDRLLYPRGLLGHAVQYVMDTAPLPDRRLALAVSLSACAKGIDRKVIGPSDNSTVLFNQVIAETGAGKHHGISCSRSLLRAMGIEQSIVASGLASVQAIEEIIEGITDKFDPNPNALVVVDEVGSWLSRILSKSQGGNVSEIPGILQTLWGQPLEDAWIGTKKVGKEMRTFFAVAFSIIGFSTEKMFFRALEDRLVSSGFVNRMLMFDVGRGALERVDPKYSWTLCPEWLVKAFRRVTALEAAPLNAPMRLTLPLKDGSSTVIRDFHRVGWGLVARFNQFERI